MKKFFRWGWKVVVGIGSAIIWVLSIPRVRKFLWKKAKRYGDKKIVDAEARVMKNRNKR